MARRKNKSKKTGGNNRKNDAAATTTKNDKDVAKDDFDDIVLNSKASSSSSSSNKVAYLIGLLAVLVGLPVTVWQQRAPAGVSLAQYYGAGLMQGQSNSVFGTSKAGAADESGTGEDGPDYSYKQPNKFQAPSKAKDSAAAATAAATNETTSDNAEKEVKMTADTTTSSKDTTDTDTSAAVVTTTTTTETPSTPLSSPWKLLGSRMVGPHNRSQFGFSLDISDDLVVAVGIPGWKNDTGAAQLYTYGGTNLLGDRIEDEWVPAQDLFEGPEPELAFGRTVSYDTVSHKVAVGGHGGAVVYKQDGQEWAVDHDHQPMLKGSVKANGYGFQVALRGDHLTVSEPGYGKVRGAVYTLDHNDDSYETLETLLGKNEDDQSGVSVQLSQDGSTLAVGSPMFGSKKKDLEKAGHVRVLTWDDVEGWSMRGKDIVGAEAHDWSGQSVALSRDGTIVAIGSPGHDDDTLKDARESFYDEMEELTSEERTKIAKETPEKAIPPGNDIGQVRVLQFDGTSWKPLGQDILGEEKGDQFGFSVSLSADGMTLAVGAVWNRGAESNGYGARAGQVRTYKFDGARWNQMGMDLDGQERGDWFGQSVKLSPDGTKMAIGAICRNNGWQGYVKVFELGDEEEQEEQ